MRNADRSGAARRGFLVMLAALFLAILACGVPVEMAPLPVDEGESAQQVEDVAAPIETLAPLPTVVIGGESIPIEGESLDVGDLRWTLLQAVELGDRLESDSEAVGDLVAGGRLVGIRFQVENRGGIPLTFVGMEVVDDQGGGYTYLVEALPFIIEEEACEVEELEPAAVITCTALYDVDLESTGLQGVLTDLNLLGGEEILVNLELG